MDKLKAIQYFLSAAQSGSLSAAARQQGVTLQAVAKLRTERDDIRLTIIGRPRSGASTLPGKRLLDIRAWMMAMVFILMKFWHS